MEISKIVTPNGEYELRDDNAIAAYGTTSGTATALTLASNGFSLKDGAMVKFKLHVDSGATPTLNVNGTGAKALMQSKYKPMKAATPAGTWVIAIYSEDFDFFVLQGSGSGDKRKYGSEPGQISSFELMSCAGMCYANYNKLWP